MSIPRITLAVGSEALLVDRAVLSVSAAVRAAARRQRRSSPKVRTRLARS